MSNWCHIVFRSFAGNEPFHTAGHMTRPRGPRPGGNVQQQLQQHTLPAPGLMPQPFHGAPAVHDYGAQERFLRELQRNPSRWPFHVLCVSVSPSDCLHLRFSMFADTARVTNVRIIIIIITSSLE